MAHLKLIHGFVALLMLFCVYICRFVTLKKQSVGVSYFFHGYQTFIQFLSSQAKLENYVRLFFRFHISIPERNDADYCS